MPRATYVYRNDDNDNNNHRNESSQLDKKEACAAL